MKRCVWDGGMLHRKTESRWTCGKCGMHYGFGLMTNKDAWKEFRRRATAAIAAERATGKPDFVIRPDIGATLAAIMQQMKRENV